MSELDELVEKARTFPSLLSLDGRKALVVGGNRGLGQGMALALASAGADVTVAARGPAGLAETAEAVGRLGKHGYSHACDATDEESVKELMAKTREQMGRIDILVNSQGQVHLAPAVDYDMADWTRIMDINLKSLVLTCKHAGKIMLEQGKGKIINISSVRGFQGRACDLSYPASKGAVNQLTRSLAIEWGPKGINVNAIAPSFINSAIARSILDDPEKRAWVYSRSPMGRIGETEDMFGPVLFLASDVSSFVNGHVLMVDGGWVIA